MNIRAKLTIIAILLASASFVLFYLINRYELTGVYYGWELLIPLVLFSGMIMYLYADKLAKRMDGINTKIGMIVKGHYKFEISPLEKDELGKIENELNQLAKHNQGIIKREKQEAITIQTILSGIKEGVILLDRLGKIILVNSAIEEMFGRNQKMLENKPLMSLLRNHDLELLIESALKDKQKSKLELPFRERIFSVWVSVLDEEDFAVRSVLVFRDVTELRRLERLRTEFVANVSHELMTPLTSIKGFVETLIDGAGDDKEVRDRFLKVIQKESLRLQGIIDDLLALSRIESKPQKESKNRSKRFSFVQNAYEKIKPVIESYAQAKGLNIEVQIPADLPYVFISEDLLSQVLLNLMENAIKYTSEGQIKLNCLAGEKNVIVEISDTGCGIPQESQARIFERFYRVDKARSRDIGGTGLGLSIVKHIIEGSGGSIEVSSEIGEGTTFRCYLPCTLEVS
ncbi:MAG: hypothetical protein APF84_16065 [Gracilibacter sp. BRH_c7a]|nr:MAG: hypothetical protein APF84_16065 [Gracilibacter sp. BRH_c7a]